MSYFGSYGGETPIPKPSLIEPGVKYFLRETLKQCHNFKEKYHNFLFNVGLFLAFLFVVGLILLYKYKGRLTPVEREQKTREKQQYILSKIKTFQEAKKQAHQELITGLPNWENEHDEIRQNQKLYL
jgi:hypothetical protein